MASVRSSQAVIAGVDMLAGRALGSLGVKYYWGVTQPLLDAITEAKSFEGARQRLSPALVKRMNAAAIEESLGSAAVQAAMIGDAAARPVKQGATKRRSDEATKGTKR